MPKPIGQDKFDSIFKMLHEGGKSLKEIAYRTGVSVSLIYKIRESMPLFFGPKRPYNFKKIRRSEDD